MHSHDLKHATLVTARSPFLLVAAKIWGHAGRVGISYLYGAQLNDTSSREPAQGIRGRVHQTSPDEVTFCA